MEIGCGECATVLLFTYFMTSKYLIRKLVVFVINLCLVLSIVIFVTSLRSSFLFYLRLFHTHYFIENLTSNDAYFGLIIYFGLD